MSLSRQLIEEAIRFSQPVAFVADTGRGNLKGVGPVVVFSLADGFDAACDKIVRYIDNLHNLEMNFSNDPDGSNVYEPRQALDQLVAFYRLCVFFTGTGPNGPSNDTMLSMTDRPTLSNETREWIFKRLDPNPRDPLIWYRSLDGDSREITYDHVVFSKSRPQHVGMPALDEPIEIDVPEEDPPARGLRGRLGRRLGR